MESTLESEKNSGSHLTSRRIVGHISLQSAQSTTLGDRLRSDKSELSYADFRPEILDNGGAIPSKTARAQPKQYSVRKTIENEDLVKYMSSLPRYLEKGETPQEKAFSVGVLDWRRLEKWQHKHRDIPCRSRGCSPSSSNTSSFSSTDGSSSNSSRGHSCSPAGQSIHRPTRKSHLNVSPPKGSCHNAKSFAGSGENVQNIKPGTVKFLRIEQHIGKTCQSLDENTQSNLKELSKALHPQSTSRIRKSLDIETQAKASSSKGKMKIQEGEFLSNVEDDVAVSCCGVDDHNCIERHQTDVLQVPEACQENISCSTSCPYDSAVEDRGAVKSSRWSFSSGSHSMFYSGYMSSDMPPSCLLPGEADGRRHSMTENATSIDAKGSKFSPEKTQPLAYPGKFSTSPHRGNNLQEKLTVMLKNPTELDSLEGPNQNNGTSETIKVRNPSPTRRFSMAMGKIGRISGKKDTSAIHQGVKQRAAISGKERAQTSLLNSGCDKSEATGRARTSPLRRLLDPLLKPKAGNSDRVTGSSDKESASTDKICKSSTKRGESPNKRSLKVKLDLKSCKNIEIDDPCSSGKCGATTLQALLQVVVKNGVPLFTFAVDNESDILAATMKKFGSSLKENGSWVYNFFTVRETKKKSGSWLNQGGKDKSHSIMPNIIGKMKVSDVSFSGLNKQKFDSQFRMKEFVLFAIDTRHAGSQASDLEQNDELAAIVVKLPNRSTPYSNHQHGNQDTISASVLTNSSSEEVSNCTDSCNEDNNRSCAGYGDLNMTVILPGGAHGQPSKGEPSSLIERWKSGGSCDCGGWDMGCKLRLLVNHTNCRRKSISAKAAPHTERFELFTKGDVQDSKPIFSLSPFKDGIFSVEFSSSLKLLQAFTICIAVLNGRNLEKFSEMATTLIAENTSEVTMLPEVLEGAQDEFPTPTKFVSIPPLSPVGRV